jgi:hypothetical protein
MEFEGSCFIRAIVGVIGSVFVDVVVEQMFRLSAFDFELLECVDGDEGGGSVAAVHVSVTGHSSDFTLIVVTVVVDVDVVGVILLKKFEFSLLDELPGIFEVEGPLFHD